MMFGVSGDEMVRERRGRIGVECEMGSGVRDMGEGSERGSRDFCTEKAYDLNSSTGVNSALKLKMMAPLNGNRRSVCQSTRRWIRDSGRSAW